MLNDPKAWSLKIPAPAFDVIGFQRKLDAIAGTSGGKPIVRLMWSWDVHEPKFGEEVWRYTIRWENGRRVIAPRWVLEQRLEPGQYYEQWQATRFMKDPGTGEMRDRGEPPTDGYYKHLDTIAEHDEFCCGLAWTEDRRSCVGKYREPGQDVLDRLNKARIERDLLPYVNPHEPLSDTEIAAAFAEGTSKYKEYEEQLATERKARWQDFVKFYGHKGMGESKGTLYSLPGYTATDGGLLVPEGI